MSLVTASPVWNLEMDQQGNDENTLKSYRSTIDHLWDIFELMGFFQDQIMLLETSAAFCSSVAVKTLKISCMYKIRRI